MKTIAQNFYDMYFETEDDTQNNTQFLLFVENDFLKSKNLLGSVTIEEVYSEYIEYFDLLSDQEKEKLLNDFNLLPKNSLWKK